MKKITFTISLLSLLTLAFFSFNSPKQLFTTSLQLTVLDDLGNPVENAKVNLYLNQEDYRQEQNPAAEMQTTDNKGRVKFTKLEPKVYFVDAKKGDMSNAGAGVQTDTLQERRINKVNIIIE